MKIVSGGQTGVDRAALDAAIELGIEHGGYCPKGRGAEDGVIDKKYQLTETDSEDVDVRTRKNIDTSDGTLIFSLTNNQTFNDGTQLTLEYAKRQRKPILVVSQPTTLLAIRDWIVANQIKTLNIAGPRESNAPGIYQQCFDTLMKLLPELDKTQTAQSTP